METKSQRQKRRNDALPSLDAAIASLNLGKDKTSVEPVKNLFAAASILLETTRVSFHPTHVVSDYLLIYTGLCGQRSGLRGTRSILR